MLLGIDVGTTHTKACLYTVDGVERCSAVERTATRTAKLPPGWAEYDADSLWQGVLNCLRRLAAEDGAAYRSTQAIAVSSIGESGALFDASGRAISPFIAWYDPRARRQVEWVTERVGAQWMHQHTGMPTQAKFALYHMLWWKAEHPELFLRAKHWLHVADYITFRFCGVMATEFSVAGRSAALDVSSGEWSLELLRTVDLPVELFPPLCTSATPLGRLSAQAAEETGLGHEVVVAAGGHDHICAGLSAGAVHPDVLLDSKGTAEAVLSTALSPRVTEGVQRGSVAVARHVVPGRFTYLRGQPSGGRSIDWIKEILGLPAGYDELHTLLANAPEDPTGVVYLPNLTGSVDDPVSGFVGLHWHRDRAQVAKAVLEGLCFELKRIVQLMPREGRTAHSVVRVVGGGAKLLPWLQLTADVLCMPVEVSPIKEAACHGAALSAGIGAGLYPDFENASSCVADRYRRVEPRTRAAESYRDFFEQYVHIRERLE